MHGYNLTGPLFVEALFLHLVTFSLQQVYVTETLVGLGPDMLTTLVTAKKDPTCEYVFLRILIPLIPNLVTVWRYRTPFLSAPLRITPLWRGYSFQNWGCSYNHHSIQSFARGYHDEFP